MSTSLGIDIGGTNIKAAVVHEDGRVAAFETSAWSGGAVIDALETVERLAAEVGSSSGLSFDICGCGCAGLVDHEAGVVHRSPNLPQWHDVRLAEELAVGAARGATNAVMVTIGTGIGGGIVLGGSIYRGSHGFAAEIGHSVIDLTGGVQCGCGSTGCVEPLVNAASLVVQTKQRMDEGAESALAELAGPLTARAVGEAAAAGDQLARSVTADVGRTLGVLLSNIVAYLDPDVIVIGGGVAAAGSSLMDTARGEFAARTSIYQGMATRIVMAELGRKAGVVGAALLAASARP